MAVAPSLLLAENTTATEDEVNKLIQSLITAINNKDNDVINYPDRFEFNFYHPSKQFIEVDAIIYNLQKLNVYDVNFYSISINDDKVNMALVFKSIRDKQNFIKSHFYSYQKEVGINRSDFIIAHSLYMEHYNIYVDNSRLCSQHFKRESDPLHRTYNAI